MKKFFFCLNLVLPLLFATSSFAEDHAPSQSYNTKVTDNSYVFHQADESNLGFVDCILDASEDDDITHTERKNSSLKTIPIDLHLQVISRCFNMAFCFSRTGTYSSQHHPSLYIFLGNLRI
jgi:hypothetical protein